MVSLKNKQPLNQGGCVKRHTLFDERDLMQLNQIGNTIMAHSASQFNTATVSAIPAELRNLNQWVCWHYEQRDGKPTKAPIQAKSNGKLLYAKSNDPATWSGFDDAVASAIRLNLEGVGLNVWENDRLTGLDLDHVIDPATGELDPLASDVLKRFAGTYTEISPSGTGIRIWCYGKPGRSGKCDGKRKWLEVYSHPSRRYLTVTGRHWPGSSNEVTDQQDALDWLHSHFMDKSKDDSTEREEVHSRPSVDSLDDMTLLDKAGNARNGSEFNALWSGDTSRHNDDHSAADLALLNILAFWTGKDSSRMDQLFRQSGLMRDKWDEAHYSDGQTYGQVSIDKAIADCREVYSGRSNDSYSRIMATQSFCVIIYLVNLPTRPAWAGLVMMKIPEFGKRNPEQRKSGKRLCGLFAWSGLLDLMD